MNKKGFVGFILVLAMATLLLFFTIQLNENKQNFDKTKNELIKAEQANSKRTLLENNIDKIIEAKLNEQITIQNFNTSKARNLINSKLAEFLKEKAKIYSYNGQTNEVSTLFLNQNSSVQLLKSQYYIYAEYVYSPNLTTTQIKQIFGEKLTSEFIFPINYTKTIMRIV